MFSSSIDNKNGDYNLLFYKDNFLELEVKAIYLPNNFDESDIKLIKCILDGKNIKLYKIIKYNDAFRYLPI